MSQVVLLQEIIKVYQKHGWTLHSLLITNDLRIKAADFLAGLSLQNVRVEPAEVDAVWFSRRANAEREAWELRLVQSSPYALFETFARDAPEAERAAARRRMERRLIASKQQTLHLKTN